MISELARSNQTVRRARGREKQRQSVNVVENGVHVSSRQRCVRDAERGSRYREYPARYWQTVSQQIIGNANRKRPPCDSSIIESLISVRMRPLSRSRALCPGSVPYFLALPTLVLFLPPAISSIPFYVPFAASSSFTCRSTSGARVPTNEQMHLVCRMMFPIQVHTCCRADADIRFVFAYVCNEDVRVC